MSGSKIILWQAVLLLLGIGVQEWYLCSSFFPGSDLFYAPAYLAASAIVLPLVQLIRKREKQAESLCLLFISPLLFFVMAQQASDLPHKWSAKDLLGPARIIVSEKP